MPKEKEYKYTMDDLYTMQAWPLSRKIQVTQTRLMEWKIKFRGKIYISFSGGKDSTVLADLAARIYASDQKLNQNESDPLTLVFVNTGLEYPEIRRFVKEFAEWLRVTYEIPVNLEIRNPELSFPEVLSKYGYPVIGKEVAKVIYYAKRGSGWALKRLDGLDKHGKPSKFKERYKKYKFMIDAPFDTSQLCCNVMKKGPAKSFMICSSFSVFKVLCKGTPAAGGFCCSLSIAFKSRSALVSGALPLRAFSSWPVLFPPDIMNYTIVSTLYQLAEQPILSTLYCAYCILSILYYCGIITVEVVEWLFQKRNNEQPQNMSASRMTALRQRFQRGKKRSYTPMQRLQTAH